MYALLPKALPSHPDTGLFHEKFLRVAALRGDHGDEVGSGGEALEVEALAVAYYSTSSFLETMPARVLMRSR